MAKDVKGRFRDIGDVQLAMSGEVDETDTASPPLAGSRRLRMIAAAAVFLLGIVAGGVVSRSTRPAEIAREVARFSIPMPEGVTVADWTSDLVALSPDGSRFVFSADDRLYVRAMERTEATPLRGTESGRGAFFSPDGEWVGFFADGHLKKVAVGGGTPVILCEAPVGPVARWEADGTIVFGQTGAGILRVSADGGTPEVLVPFSETGQRVERPQILPGGKAVLFTVGTPGNWDEARIFVHSLETGDRKTLIEGGRDARYVATGHLLYVAEETLFAMRFDVDALAVVGGAVPVEEGIRSENSGVGTAQYSVSDTGTLIYVPGGAESLRTLVWVDRYGREEAIAAEPGAYYYPRTSPDGSRVALDVRDQANDIWIWDFARETLTRLTFSSAADVAPLWTPDAKRIVFSSIRDGLPNLYRKTADGAGAIERLTESENYQFPTGFTPDGTQLVFDVYGNGRSDLAVLSPDGATETLLGTEFDERNGVVSADGRWLAYQSDVSGQHEIYVRPFPNIENEQWRISQDGGIQPLWSRDGNELFYLTPDSRLMAVAVETGPRFAPGEANELFGGYPPGGRLRRSYDISPDGKLFLMVKGGAGAKELILVQNWFEELRRLLPTDS